MKMKPPKTNRLLKTGDLAKLVGCCETTVLRMARRGDLPGAKKLGGQYFFPPDVIDRLFGQTG